MIIFASKIIHSFVNDNVIFAPKETDYFVYKHFKSIIYEIF